MVVQTRSQCREAYPQRPQYPHLSTNTQSNPSSDPRSTASSVFQSSSSLDSLSSSTSSSFSYSADQGSLHPLATFQGSNMLSQSFGNSAPLPSPSSSQPINYFAQALPLHFPQQPQQYQQQQQQQQYAPPTSNPFGQQTQYAAQGPSQVGYQQQDQYLGQRGIFNGVGGGLPETAPFLKDFNLVAEAAKRAQMACLVRDLGDCGL